MLLFGSKVEKDLYDWRSDSLHISCENSSYIDLINCCFHSNITTQFIASFVRSICLYEFSNIENQNNFKKRELDVNQTIQNLQTTEDLNNYLQYLIHFKFSENDSILQKLIDFGMEKENTMNIIALLSTITPKELKLKLQILKQNDKQSFNNSNLSTNDFNSIKTKIKESLSFGDVTREILKLGRMNKNDAKVIEILLDCLKDYRWYQ